MNPTVPCTLAPCSDADAIAAIVTLPGLQLLDVGCGDGALARVLAQQGARLLGLEPDANQMEKTLATPAGRDVQFVVAGGDAIPLDDGTVDGVLFVRSLHHVPVRLMDTALREACRVLQPSGFLMVIEPEIESPFSQLMTPFHDEAIVRTAARNALARIVPEVFSRTRECHYTTERRFADFGDFVAQMVAATFREVQSEQVDAPEVRALFERGQTENGYVFAQRMRINLFNR
jgi:ubiquinone/menaquinone biosynthesis C-methylase UbiE